MVARHSSVVFDQKKFDMTMRKIWPWARTISDS